MIQDITLTDAQRAALERGIERLYASEKTETMGLEVTGVSQYANGEYRVFYTYEIQQANGKCRDVQTSGFFFFHLTDWGIDSVEFAN